MGINMSSLSVIEIFFCLHWLLKNVFIYSSSSSFIFIVLAMFPFHYLFEPPMLIHLTNFNALFSALFIFSDPLILGSRVYRCNSYITNPWENSLFCHAVPSWKVIRHLIHTRIVQDYADGDTNMLVLISWKFSGSMQIIIIQQKKKRDLAQRVLRGCIRWWMRLDYQIWQIEHVQMKAQLEWSEERMEVKGVWTHFTRNFAIKWKRYGTLAVGSL